MAKKITLKNPDNGMVATAYHGLSWTTLFFGLLPMAFRGDWKDFFIIFIVSGLTAGAAAFLWAVVGFFVYNKWHARRLMEQGFSQVLHSDSAPDDVVEAQLKGAA